MSIRKMGALVLGLAAVVIGAYFIFSGNKTMDKTSQKIHHKVTGKYSKDVKSHFAGGIILVVVGAGLLYYFYRQKR